MGDGETLKVRLTDVATAAGVSQATASKALAGSHEISEATTRRVRQAAFDLGYRPLRRQRPARRGALRTVGLLSDDEGGRAVAAVLAGAARALPAEQLSVLHCESGGDPERRERQLHTFLERGVDGLVVLAPSAEVQASLGPVPVPVVYLRGPSDDAADASLVPAEAATDETGLDRLGEEAVRALYDAFSGTVRRGVQAVPPGPTASPRP